MSDPPEVSFWHRWMAAMRAGLGRATLADKHDETMAMAREAVAAGENFRRQLKALQSETGGMHILLVDKSPESNGHG